MPFDPTDYEIRAKLALGCRILAMQGHSDFIWGHMSLRSPENPSHFWMKAAHVGLEEITADDLVLIDFEGKELAGMRKRHNEFPIHAEIMRARPEINVVVHTHPVLPTLLGSSTATIQPITHEGSYLSPPEIPVFGETSDLIVTRDQGESVARALGGHRALFMKNHGVVLAAPTIEEAVFASALLDRAAQAQLAALAMGVEVSVTDDAEALQKREHIYHQDNIMRAWEYLVRKVDRWPGI
jgi:L-fuculose-phosphate aldolase